VHLPKEAAWLAEYLHELTVFPKGKHDDQVDSTAQMLDWFKRAGQEPQDWMWQMYKQAQARGPEPARPEPLSVMAKRLGILRPLRQRLEPRARPRRISRMRKKSVYWSQIWDKIRGAWRDVGDVRCAVGMSAARCCSVM